MKEINDTNKAAWEEAFDKRCGDYGKDISEQLTNDPLRFLDKPFRQELLKMSFKQKCVGQFCSNNGRELLGISKHFECEGIGFDIAENMVEYANEVAKNLGINCSFVAKNILDIPSEYDQTFDFLIVTVGALCWFEDLHPFFEKASRCLKEGGRILVNEMHPLGNMLAVKTESNFREDAPKNLVNSYFRKEPWIETDGMGYVAGEYESKPFISFSHTMEELFDSLVSNGLSIVRFMEFDEDNAGLFDHLNHQGLPLSYLLIAKKG